MIVVVVFAGVRWQRRQPWSGVKKHVDTHMTDKNTNKHRETLSPIRRVNGNLRYSRLVEKLTLPLPGRPKTTTMGTTDEALLLHPTLLLLSLFAAVHNSRVSQARWQKVEAMIRPATPHMTTKSNNPSINQTNSQ